MEARNFLDNIFVSKVTEYFRSISSLQDRELIVIGFLVMGIPIAFWCIVQVVRKIKTIRLRRLDDIIFKNSGALLELNHITSEMREKLNYRLPEYLQSSVLLDSKDRFDRFDSKREVHYLLYERRAEYKNSAERAYANREAYAEYSNEARQIYEKLGIIPENVLKELKKIGFSQERYIERERELYCKWGLKCPSTSVGFRLNWSYTSPQGRNHYYNYAIYSQSECLYLIDEEENRQKNYEQYQSSAQYERSQMSPGLRFKVLKRDHYRCCICGRSQKEDGVKLEVDHKIPVSKGGKTEMNNLWTLCFECNRGKSNKEL